MDAPFIHTGVNDVENDLLDAKTIAKWFLMQEKNFQKQSCSFRKLHQEVTVSTKSNSLLKNCPFSISNFKPVIHSNLAGQTYFYDDKQLNRYKGIPSLARNLKSCYFNRNQLSTHSK